MLKNVCKIWGRPGPMASVFSSGSCFQASSSLSSETFWTYLKAHRSYAIAKELANENSALIFGWKIKAILSGYVLTCDALRGMEFEVLTAWWEIGPKILPSWGNCVSCLFCSLPPRRILSGLEYNWRYRKRAERIWSETSDWEWSFSTRTAAPQEGILQISVFKTLQWLRRIGRV